MQKTCYSWLIAAVVICSAAPVAAQESTRALLPQAVAAAAAGEMSTPPELAAAPPTAPPTAPAAGSGASPESFIKSLGRDFRLLASKETALTLGIGGAAALAVVPIDRNLTSRASASPALDRTLEAGNAVGSGWVQVGGSLGALVMGRVTGNARMQSIGSDLLRAQALNAMLTQGLKVTVGRTRPDGARYSFPSGHASATFATATVLHQRLGWKAGIPAYIVASGVAASRLQENKHFASDVIFGAALGIVAGRTATIGRGSARFAMSPTVVRGGVGVTFSRIGSS